MRSGPDVGLFTGSRGKSVAAHGTVASFPDLDNADLRRRLVDAVRGTGARQVLEVGCGDGTLTRALVELGCHVIAVDNQADVLDRIDLSADDVTRFHWDLHQPLELNVLRTCDVVVGAYLLHEFVADRQIDMIRGWTAGTRLGTTLIADIGFPTNTAFDAARHDLAERWNTRHSYLSGETITNELETLGLRSRWDQVTHSAGLLAVRRT